MQRSAGDIPNQGTLPFFAMNIWGNNSNNSSTNNNTNATSSASLSQSGGVAGRSRPGTSSGEQSQQQPVPQSREHGRKPSFGRKSSFSSPSKGKRRASSSASNGGGGVGQVITDATAPPALPDYALAAAAKISRETETIASPTTASTEGHTLTKKMSRSTSLGSTGVISNMSGLNGPGLVSPQSSMPSAESPSSFNNLQELVNKRISTLDYLRKAHEGRVYWFNTLLIDKPDLARMPYFDNRKLARRATNYLLLGLSIPVVIDLNSANPLEFLRSLNTLLTEFDSYQQIHTENGVNSSSLSRARLPQMFRRQGGKGRRQSGAANMEYVDPNGGSFINKDGSALNAAPATFINFGLGGEGNDLIAGEEYTHLLTPNLPFDPDYFETFATLCDVLIDCYSRLMGLITSSKDCTPMIVDLFTKADSRVRKMIIQGVVKEFEDSSRTGVKQEVSSVSKVVLGGLI